ncbi:hypothetical protein FHW88_006035 [Mucilaginibacter sp. SG538B]|nr:hypothetical protein [Mucilaginibacter sp. SG538B]
MNFNDRKTLLLAYAASKAVSQLSFPWPDP